MADSLPGGVPVFLDGTISRKKKSENYLLSHPKKTANLIFYCGDEVEQNKSFTQREYVEGKKSRVYK